MGQEEAVEDVKIRCGNSFAVFFQDRNRSVTSKDPSAGQRSSPLPSSTNAGACIPRRTHQFTDVLSLDWSRRFFLLPA